MRLLWICAILSILGSCQRRAPEPRGDHEAELPASVLASYPLRLDLLVPPRAEPGQPVHIQLTLTNIGDQPVRIETGDSAYSFDLVVTRPDGKTVWSRLHEVEAIPLVGRTRVLAPGEGMTFEDHWDLRTDQGKQVASGTYLVYGLLDADSIPYRMLRTEPRTLSITRY